MYIPPNLKADQYQTITDYVISSVDNILDNDLVDGSLLIAGDLNQFPTSMIETTLSLKQIVKSPTRGNSILDKILVDSKLHDKYGSVIIGPNFGNADHNTVMIKPATPESSPTCIKKVYDYRQSHMSNFLNRLHSTNWKQFYYTDQTVQTKCDIFYSTIDEALNEIPFTYVEMTEKDKPWITPLLKHLINCRYQAFHERNFRLFNHFKYKIRSEIQKAKSRWSDKLKMSKTSLWNIVNDIKGRNRPNVANLLCLPPDEAANIINDRLADHFTEPPDWSSVTQSITGSGSASPWTTDTSVPNVRTLIRNLNLKKSPGCDNLTPQILRISCDILEGPIAHLFSLSFQQKSIPLQWKKANVIPIPKKKNPSVNDLRPISLLPLLAKILEKIALQSVRMALINMYGQNQFGFRPQSSTLHAQVKSHDFITQQLDDTRIRGVAMTSFDLSRAFDRLSHEKLLKSLNQQLPPDFLLWCADYLQGRSQRVRLQGEVYSNFRNVSSGVPQGSVLSPYLFAAHMGSLLPSNSKNLMIKYADDVVILIPYCDEETAERELCTEIMNMSNWCEVHGLTLNNDKTKVMFIDKRKEKPSITVEIPQVTKLKFLGITFQNDLKWNEHINQVCKAASQRVYLLKRLKNTPLVTKKDLIQIYNACIVGVLDYNSPLYVALNHLNSYKLERIQKRCHKIICGPDCSCDNFASLTTKRTSRALKFFESLFNTSNVLHDLAPTFLRHSGHVRLPHCKTERRKHSFIPYCSMLFNIQQENTKKH
jgi:hypothetical protein